MMAVAVETRPVFRAGTPQLLFDGVYNLRSDSGISYDVDPKHKRLLMIRLADESTSSTNVHVVLNWFAELRRLTSGR